MSSHTDSLFGRIAKGLGRSSENLLWQDIIGLIAERAWERANTKEVATSGGYEGLAHPIILLTGTTLVNWGV